MRRPVVDELEERRVTRRLACLAEAVEPLADRELRAILAGVVTGVVPVRRPPRRGARLARQLPGLAAAAAAAVAVTVGIGHSERSTDDQHVRGTAPEQLLSFPEGSALELLLARAGSERPT